MSTAVMQILIKGSHDGKVPGLCASSHTLSTDVRKVTIKIQTPAKCNAVEQ